MSLVGVVRSPPGSPTAPVSPEEAKAFLSGVESLLERLHNHTSGKDHISGKVLRILRTASDLLADEVNPNLAPQPSKPFKRALSVHDLDLCGKGAFANTTPGWSARVKVQTLKSYLRIQGDYFVLCNDGEFAFDVRVPPHVGRSVVASVGDLRVVEMDIAWMLPAVANEAISFIARYYHDITDTFTNTAAIVGKPKYLSAVDGKSANEVIEEAERWYPGSHWAGNPQVVSSDGSDGGGSAGAVGADGGGGSDGGSDADDDNVHVFVPDPQGRNYGLPATWGGCQRDCNHTKTQVVDETGKWQNAKRCVYTGKIVGGDEQDGHFIVLPADTCVFDHLNGIPTVELLAPDNPWATVPLPVNLEPSLARSMVYRYAAFQLHNHNGLGNRGRLSNCWLYHARRLYPNAAGVAYDDHEYAEMPGDPGDYSDASASEDDDEEEDDGVGVFEEDADDAEWGD